MGRLIRTLIVALTLGAAFVALGALAKAMAMRFGNKADRQRRRWTVHADHVAVIPTDANSQDNGSLAMTTTAHVWFAAGVGWRIELSSRGPMGNRHRILGNNGSVRWTYDPVSNRYALNPSTTTTIDPRAELEVMRATAGTEDLKSAIAALQQLSNVKVSIEGDDTVTGRRATVIRMIPHSCVEVGEITAAGGIESKQSCQSATRLWLDGETGWVLRVEAGYSERSGFHWDTSSISFDNINPAMFQFDPPPASTRVDDVDL